MQRNIDENKVIFPKDGIGTPMYKRHLAELRSDRKPYSSLLTTVINTVATKETRETLGGQYFDYPKSVDLLKQLVNQATLENDIILDFFSGSATTAHAVMQLNARRWWQSQIHHGAITRKL
jgi:adenine-specific DNA-methyltransferase